MTGSTTWIEAEEHGACSDNIWLAPEFASHSNCTTKVEEQVKRMTAFLEATGQKYWKEATKWEMRNASGRFPLPLSLQGAGVA